MSDFIVITAADIKTAAGRYQVYVVDPHNVFTTSHETFDNLTLDDTVKLLRNLNVNMVVGGERELHVSNARDDVRVFVRHDDGRPLHPKQLDVVMDRLNDSKGKTAAAPEQPRGSPYKWTSESMRDGIRAVVWGHLDRAENQLMWEIDHDIEPGADKDWQAYAAWMFGPNLNRAVIYSFFKLLPPSSDDDETQTWADRSQNYHRWRTEVVEPWRAEVNSVVQEAVQTWLRVQTKMGPFRPKTAQATPRYMCDNEKRNAIRTCAVCAGEGVVECPECKGDGCKRCGDDGMIGCANCNTSGNVPGDADVIPLHGPKNTERTARLVQRDHDGKKEWALVSTSNPGQVLKWFGTNKPSAEAVAKEERRVQYFKHEGQAQQQPTVAVDLDGTLLMPVDYDAEQTPSGQPALSTPMKGAASAMRSLRDLGWRVLVHTARIGAAQDAEQARSEIASHLATHDIHFDEVVVGPKPIADAYIDDKAIEFRGDWYEVLRRVTTYKGDQSSDDESDKTGVALIDAEPHPNDWSDEHLRRDQSIPR